MNVTGYDYYIDIIASKGDMIEVNILLNEALRDGGVPSESKQQYNYGYLCTVAKSIGFSFGRDWSLL